MAKQLITIGTPGAGGGEPAHAAFKKINDNTDDVYSFLGADEFGSLTPEGAREALSVASLDENKKVPVAELPIATSSVAGVMKLIDDLITGGTDAALTAEQGKQFLNMFAGGSGYFRIPNPVNLNKPRIVQFGSLYVAGGAGGTTINLPIAFPNNGLAFSAFWIQGAQVLSNVPTYMGNFTPNRAQFKIFTNQEAGNNGTYWFAIGE